MENNDSSQIEFLKACLRREVMMSDKPFSWLRVIHKAIKCPERRFNFWWRIAAYLHRTDSRFLQKRAVRINRRLSLKYGTEIQLSAQIGPGLVISHYQSIVINGAAVIGHSFKIRQNTTIGISGHNPEKAPIAIVIGDNVTVGAHSCIIANQIRIGNNVTIGAMSFINKDIPDNCIIYTEKTNKLVMRDA